jgi:hypothetical protein
LATLKEEVVADIIPGLVAVNLYLLSSGVIERYLKNATPSIVSWVVVPDKTAPGSPVSGVILTVTSAVESVAIFPNTSLTATATEKREASPLATGSVIKSRKIPSLGSISKTLLKAERIPGLIAVRL